MCVGVGVCVWRAGYESVRSGQTDRQTGNQTDRNTFLNRDRPVWGECTYALHLICSPHPGPQICGVIYRSSAAVDTSWDIKVEQKLNPKTGCFFPGPCYFRGRDRILPLSQTPEASEAYSVIETDGRLEIGFKIYRSQG